jgi:DNA repair protein RecO
MEKKSDLAISLRSIAYEERHRVVTALTENFGKISALAQNAFQSRRFGGALEPMAASLWTFVERPGAELYRVEGAEIRRGFEGIRRDLNRLSIGSALCEVILRVAPDRVPVPDLFKLLANALAVLDELPAGDSLQHSNADSAFRLLLSSLIKVLQWSGHAPQIGGCLGCQAPLSNQNLDAHLLMSAESLGWYCAGCAISVARDVRAHSEVSVVFLRDIALALTAPVRIAVVEGACSEAQVRESFGWLDRAMAFHLPSFDREGLQSLKLLGIDGRTVPLQR